jgi:hypothetical protein
LLVKFDRDRVPSKKFFSPQGFHYWDELNSQYQGSSYCLTSSGLPLLGRAQQPVPRWFVLNYTKCFSPQGSTTGTSSTASTKVVRIDLQEVLQSSGLQLLGRAQQPVPRWFVLTCKFRASTTGTSSTSSTKVVRIDLPEVLQSPGLPLLGRAQQPIPSKAVSETTNR